MIDQANDRSEPTNTRGRLKIGDDWNAITIIALSQSSPLKAIAELVENSIDANARTVTITRSREHGRHFLAIRDDGEGVSRDARGRPDFRYVATHICDSVKRRLKSRWQRRTARRIRHWAAELLDGRGGTGHDLDGHRPAGFSDGNAQGRSGLFGFA
jgi:hypothetical protein